MFQRDIASRRVKHYNRIVISNLAISVQARKEIDVNVQLF